MPKSRTPARGSGAPRPAPGGREPLTRERIAQAALELIDEEGLESCSMRRLGARLGVEAMALYHHFAGKGQLLDAVMDRLLEEVEVPPPGSMPALQRLRRCMSSWREVAVRHPPAFIVLAGRRFNTERSFRLYESILDAFAELGLDAAQTARWFRLLGNFASGAGLADVASRERVPDATPLRLARQPDSIAYPRVRAIAANLQVGNLDALFEFGLDTLFDALERSVVPGAAPRKARIPKARTRRSA
jgi:AcrR family transcriptional regulator